MTGHMRTKPRKRGFGGAAGALSAAALAVVGLAVPAETAAAAEPSITISYPSDGTRIEASAAVSASFACAPEAGAVLATCTATVTPAGGSAAEAVDVADGDPIPTTALGTFTITVTATDDSGLTFQQNATYDVVDVTPPVVTGAPTTEPNAWGWYGGDVTVAWAAVDAEPSSGLVVAVTDTKVTGEGADLTVTSEQVCDAAGNCANGVLSGIHIDRTVPTVGITGVEDNATYQLGAVPSVACEATDALSGVVDECAPSGYSTGLGTWTVTAEAGDAAGNVGNATVGYTVTAAAAQVTGTVKDLSESLLPGTTIEARQAGTANLVASTVTNTDGVYSLTVPAGRYDFKVTGPEGSGLGARVSDRELSAGITTIDWTIGLAPVRLSGVVSDGVETANYGWLRFYDVDGVEAAQVQIDDDGSWEAELVPGVYRIAFSGSSPRIQFLQLQLEPQEFGADATVEVRPVVTELTVHLRDAAGLPVAGSAVLVCSFAPAGQEVVAWQYLSSRGSGSGEIALLGAPTPVRDACQLTVDPEDGPNIARTVTLTPGGPKDIELQVEPGVSLSGVVSDGVGPASYGFLRFHDSAGMQVLLVEIGDDGSWEADLVPGSYQIHFSGSSSLMRGMEFTMARRVFDVDTVVDVRPTVSQVVVHLLGADGLPASGNAELECSSRLGSLYQHTTAIGSGAGQIALLGSPTPEGSTCQLKVFPDEGPNITRTITVTPGVTNDIELQVEPGVRLSGVASDGVEPATSGWLRFYDGAGVEALRVEIGGDGSWEADLVPGSYQILFAGSSSRAYYFEFEMAPRVFDVDTVVDVRPAVSEVVAHLLGADGRPASGSAELECNFRLGSPDGDLYQYVWAFGSGSGQIALLGSPTPEGSTCQLRVYPDEGPNITRTITITPDAPNDITLFTFGAGVTLIGDPETSNDGDNVADAVEAFSPNNGDGNNDGVVDYEQGNVTSLPVLGGALGDGNAYVTVEAPANTSLSNVYTIDPTNETQVATPPPDGLTLPEGLTNFIIDSVEEGSDQTISIYTSTTAGVTGYAKYDVSTGEWSLLPSDRVEIYPDRVDITLTDGGEGDADGVVNGVIDDPGALVIVTDVTPPEVSITGPVGGAKYQFGEVPAAECHATDDMSGLDDDCEVNGYETAPGTWTVTATATDLAGNVGTAEATYTVEPWDVRGFYAPVDIGGVLNTVKAGATVPLKFEVFSGDTELRTTSSIGASFTIRPMVCGTGALEDPVELTTTGSTSLRYDEASGVFIQNWKTPRFAGCYLVTVETGDGSSVAAAFKLT